MQKWAVKQLFLRTSNELFKNLLFEMSANKTSSKDVYKQSLSRVHLYHGGAPTPSMVLQDHHLDTTVWKDFIPSDNDVFIVSPAKCGSTWLLEIVGQLLYKGDYSQVNNCSRIQQIAWPPAFCSLTGMDAFKPEFKRNRMAELNNQLNHPNIKRRLIKSHEPIESLPYNPNCKYLFIARDYRDIVWSFYNHFQNYSDYTIDLLNNPTQDRSYKLKYKFPKFDELEKKYQTKYQRSFNEYDFWKLTLTKEDSFGNKDGYPFWSQLWIAGSWLNCKHYQNIKILHYNQLKNNLKQCMYDIVQFLQLDDIDDYYNDKLMDKLVSNCSFEAMKEKAPITHDRGGMWKDPKMFFYKGTNKRWQGLRHPGF